jgi:hypothetical protein
MQRFEDEMQSFAKPLFILPSAKITLTETQTRVFVVWICLITTLAEYIDTAKVPITISDEDKRHIKKYRVPPETWAVVACSLNSVSWSAKYRRHASFTGKVESVAQHHASVMAGITPNTQISSFGLGGIFVQTFSCPDLIEVQNFRASARATGLLQLWPPPFFVWPFKPRSPKFPTKLVLDDEKAELVADAFAQKLKIMTRAALFGGTQFTH